MMAVRKLLAEQAAKQLEQAEKPKTENQQTGASTDQSSCILPNQPSVGV